MIAAVEKELFPVFDSFGDDDRNVLGLADAVGRALEEEAVGRSEAALSVMAKKFIKQRQLLAAKGFPCVPTILESPPLPLPDVLGNPPIPEGERALESVATLQQK